MEMEIGRRKFITALGFGTGGADGRIGNLQRKIGMQPADGYPGVGILVRLRQSS
jgi:membrane-bound lytic murein transglycosylase B